LHRFHKERRRSPRDNFKCGDTTHFIVDFPKRKKLDSSSNKYDYTKWNNYGKGNNKKKYRFRDKKKKFQKIMSRVCAALSDLNFSSDDSSSSEKDERPKRKTGDFIGLCLMGKSFRPHATGSLPPAIGTSVQNTLPSVFFLTFARQAGARQFRSHTFVNSAMGAVPLALV
jgi:hypothetical protein